MIKWMLGSVAVAYVVWVSVALYIARQTFPQDPGPTGADFVLSDYSRCVTVNPGPIKPALRDYVPRRGRDA